MTAVDQIRHWQSLTVEQKLDAIMREWEPNASAAVIAARIGVTRQSIIGIYHRNKTTLASCPLRDPTSAQMRPMRPKRPPPPRLKPKLIPYAGKERLNAPTQLPAQSISQPAAIQEPSPLNCALVDIPAGGCHWPVSDSPFTFCGHPASGTYCDFHTRLGQGRGSPSERRAERVLRAEML